MSKKQYRVLINNGKHKIDRKKRRKNKEKYKKRYQ